MSTKRLARLKEGEKIYLELERKKCIGDDADGLNFYSKTTGEMWMDDDDTFYTLDDLKQLANDGMPKQGDIVEVRDYEGCWYKRIFVSFYKGKVVVTNELGYLNIFDELKSQTKKIQKTLAELEKELGYEEGTLEIIN